MDITITTKGQNYYYKAATGQEAVQMFFDHVKDGTIDLEALGFIGTWHKGGSSHPFRTGPALFKAGMLTREQLDESFVSAGLEFDPSEIAAMAQADCWMVRVDPSTQEIAALQ